MDEGNLSGRRGEEGEGDSPAELLTLPDELLIHITSYVGDRYLRSFALTCRRLHYIAYPKFLIRQGLPSEAFYSSRIEIELSGNNLELIRPLARSLLLKSITRLTYSFRAVEVNFHRILLRDLKRLDAFIGRLEVLDELVLDFTHVNWNLWPSDQSNRGWSSHLGFVLNSILSVSCRSLTVLRGVPVDQANRRTPMSRHDATDYTIRPLTLGEKMLKPVAMLLYHILVKEEPKRNLTPEARTIIANSRSIRISPNARSKMALREFKIHSPLFLIYPCQEWTLAVLNSAPITALSFSNLGLSPDKWGGIISQLDIKQLVDFTVISCQIAQHDLARFLVRHPTITNLHLENIFHPQLAIARPLACSSSARSVHEYPPIPAPVPQSTLSLPNLATYATDLGGITPFLSLFHTLDSLHTVWFLSRISCGHHFDLTPLLSTYTSLVTDGFLHPNLTIGLKIVPESGSTDWLQAASFPPALLATPGAEAKCEFLGKVKYLKLEGEFVYAKHPPAWLYLFRGLETLEFERCTEPELDEKEFVEAVLACSGIATLRKLVVNGVDHLAPDELFLN